MEKKNDMIHDVCSNLYAVVGDCLHNVSSEAFNPNKLQDEKINWAITK